MTVEEDKRETGVAERLDSMFVLEFVFLQFAIHRYFFRGPDDGVISGGVAKLDVQPCSADLASSVKRDPV